MDLIIEIADILCDTVVVYAKERHYCEIIRKKGLDNNIYPSIHVKQEDIHALIWTVEVVCV